MEEERIISAKPDSLSEYFRKVWKYRSLVLTFARRDIKVKYAQTWLGVGWAVAQPAVGVFIFTFFFGYVLGWKTGNLPYALYVLGGLLGWNLFNYIVFQGTGGLQDASHIIQKTYFPKMVIPLSKVLVAFTELGVTLPLLAGLMVWYGIAPSWKIVLLPLVLLVNILCALTVVTWIAAFSYRLRDLLHLVPFMMYFGIWLTPVFFTFDTLPEKWRFVWYLNPMAGVVEAWRACLFGTQGFGLRYVPAMLAVLPLALAGMWYYAKKESEFSDYA